MIFVNFKTYNESVGINARSLLQALESASQKTKVYIFPVVSVLDSEKMASTSKLKVWIQHVDPIVPGAHTGWILPKAVSALGIKGTFLNHSEHKFADFTSLKQTNSLAKEVGLETLIFADNLEELKRVIQLKPTYVAYEPAELVGSTETSVSQAKPDIIEKAANLSREVGIPLIVGAGIHSREDVEVSVKLGAVGIAVATNIVKARNPEEAVLNLAEGFK